MSEEFEAGRDIDQALRAGIIIISQAVERQARKKAAEGSDEREVAERLQTMVHDTAAEGVGAVSTRSVPVVVPAGVDNPERGLEPNTARTAHERLHREQAWEFAYEGFLGQENGSEAAWAALPEQDKRRLAEQVYDHPEVRTVRVDLPDRIADSIERVHDADPEGVVRAVSRWDDGTDVPVVVTGPAAFSLSDGLWYAPTQHGSPVPASTLIGTDHEALGYTPEWADSIGIGATHTGRFDAAAKDAAEGMAQAQVPALPRFSEYGDALNPETAGALTAQQRVEAFTAASVDLVERPSSPAAALAVRKIGEDLKARHNLDPAAVMTDLAAERAADRRAEAPADGQDMSRAATAVAAESRPVRVVIPAGEANPARGRRPSEGGITSQEREHRKAAWQEAQEQHRLDPRSSTPWKELPFTQQSGIYNSVYDREDVRTVSVDLPVGEADQVERIAGATPSSPTPLMARGSEGDVPVLVTGPAVQATPDGPWMAPQAHGGPVPLAQAVEPTPEALGYTPDWIAQDGTIDRDRFTAAVDTAHGATPPASSENASATIDRDRVVELNGQAADYFAAQNTPGSPGHSYLTERLGTEALHESPFALGYAPGPAAQGRDGWTGLTDHLRGQGAGDEEIVAAGLGRMSSRGNVIDEFRDRAMVGIRDVDGDVVGFAGRDLSGDERAPKYTNTKGTPAFTKGDHLLGLHEAPEGAHLVRVEGPFDALAVTAAGNGKAAGVAPSGTALTATQAQLLADHSGGQVSLGLDADQAGRSALVQDYHALNDRGVTTRAVDLPDGMDPADLWVDNPSALRGAVENAPNARHAGEVFLDVTRERLASDLQSDDEEVRTEAQIELAGEEESVRASIMSARNHDDRVAATRDEPTEEDRGRPAPARAHGAPETEQAPEQEPRYDRAQATSDLGELEPDTREARQVSADGYPRSTADGYAAAKKNARHQPNKAGAARRAPTPNRARTLRR